MNDEHFTRQKEHTRETYNAQKSIFNPYFNKDVLLNSKGFHHLEFSNRRLRSRNEQMFKFKYLELALEVIRKSSTIQEYRSLTLSNGKIIKYFAMIAIVGSNNYRIRAVIKQKEGSEPIFWSVMPYTKIKNGRQKIYDEGLENG